MRKLDRERRAYIEAQGYGFQRIEHRGKHVAFVCAEGIIICGCSPSDWRESRNFRSRVRRLRR